MDNTKKTRTLKDIQEEYTQLAAKLGHAYCQIDVLNKEIPRIFEAIETLRLEQIALPKQESPNDTPEAA
jgi:chromosome segregation ATPase